MALILSAIDFLTLVIWGSSIVLLIDRYGRIPLLLIGSVGCGFSFAMVTVGLGIGTKGTYGMAVGFIFLYHLFYVSLSIVGSLFERLFGGNSTNLVENIGHLVLVHPLSVPVRDQFVADAQSRQLRRDDGELALCLRRRAHDSFR